MAAIVLTCDLLETARGPGANAAFCLGAGFKDTCADLISSCHRLLDLGPLEMLLGAVL